MIGIILKLIKSKKITKNRSIEIINEVEANNFRLSDDLKALVYEFDDSKKMNNTIYKLFRSITSKKPVWYSIPGRFIV